MAFENADDGGGEVQAEVLAKAGQENGLDPEALKSLQDALRRAGLADTPAHRAILVSAYRFAYKTPHENLIQAGFAPEYVQLFIKAVQGNSDLNPYVGDMYTWANLYPRG